MMGNNRFMTQLVLWDIDGTLVHAGAVAGDIFEQAIERVTGVRPHERVHMSGKTDPQITMEYLEMIGMSDTDRALYEVLTLLTVDLAAQRSVMLEQGRVLPGVFQALGAINNLNSVEQTLLTGNLQANARTKLEVFELDHWFDFDIGAFGSDHHDRNELVPIALDRVRRLRKREIHPRDVLVIGDSPNDLRCARAGGARCLLVATGRSSYEELEPLQPDHLLHDLSDTDEVLAAIS